MRLVALAAITRLDCLGGAGSCAFRVFLMLTALHIGSSAAHPFAMQCRRIAWFDALAGFAVLLRCVHHEAAHS